MNARPAPGLMWLVMLTTLTLIAFAANTILCRMALATTQIDASTFTAVRIGSGALTLMLLVMLFRPRGQRFGDGNWRGAVCLLLYAITFSWAYRTIDSGPGALILFAAVQITMLSYGFLKGERTTFPALCGLALSCAGLVYLLLPGSNAPEATGSALMTLAGIAWAGYTLNSRGIRDPLAATCGNFLRATPLALAILLLTLTSAQLDGLGVIYAILSGAVASGMGYALWYAVAKHLSALKAGALQLLVPILSSLGGVLLLDEAITWRLVIASIAVISGVGLVLAARARLVARKAA